MMINRIKIILNYILSIILTPFSLLFITLVYLVKPCLIIIFQVLDTDRIGHFATEIEHRAIESTISKRKIINVFSFKKDICNNFLAKIVKRKFIILPKIFVDNIIFLNKFFSKFFSNLAIHHYEFDNVKGNRDIDNNFDKTKNSLEFNNEEKLKGETFLKKYGIEDNTKFACLITRDSAYLKNTYPKKNWDKHNYRNFNIDNFIEASEQLTKDGYFVFRMGSITEKKLESENKMIVDYSFLNEKSDFLDIFLLSRCTFIISAGNTGLDAIGEIFRKPIAFILVPAINFHTWSDKFIMMTKKHFCLKNKKKIKMSEFSNYEFKDFFLSSGYEKNKIELIENDSSEIKNFIIEAKDIFEGKRTINKEIQNKFWNNYSNVINKLGIKNYHGNYKSLISETFLKNNPEWLE